MSGNSEQDELDDDLEQEQSLEAQQEAELKDRQSKIRDAEMQNLKRSEGAGQVASTSMTDEDEDTLG